MLNNPPNTPSTPSGPSSGYIGTSYSYSTSATDPDGDQVKYTFDWGDGSTSETGYVSSGTTASKSHSWSSPGTYYVKAKATDSNGASSGWSSSRAVTITKLNNPPTAYIDSISPNPADQGQSVSFSGHGTDPDAGDSITGYNWRSSIDGQLSTASSFSSSSLSVGTHTIYFKVEDSHSTWSTEVTRTLTINPISHAPTAYIDSISPNPADQGQSVSFSGHGTDPDAGDSITGYNWRSSIDGQLSTASSFSSSSLSVGTHTIYFKVKDSHSTWSTEATRTLTINPVATHPLTINSTDGGNVTTPGEGVKGPYDYGDVVNLTATADSGYQFVNWTGDVDTIADVDSRTTNITMNGNYSIMANFEETPVTYNVTVKIEPSTTYVSLGGSFTIDAVIDNPSAQPVAMHQICLNFDPNYFTVDSMSLVDLPQDMGLPTINNTAGNVDYEPHMPPGQNTTNTHIVSARISCTAKSLVGTSTISWVYTSGPPPRYTKVVKGTTDYLEGGDMSLMFNGTVMVVPGATLEGHVSFSGASEGPEWVRGLEVRFFNSTTQDEMPWSPMNRTTDEHGNFTVEGLVPGIYDIGIKNWTCLSKLKTNVTLTAGNTTVVDFGETHEGDANNDDYVDASDFGPLSNAWLSYPGQPNWDARADFSRDSYIDASDFAMLSADWLEWGDLYGV